MNRGGRNPYARPDARTRAAKASGYPARSVFKLKEIDERWRLLKPGQSILDLGAAPGLWSMYAAERVGKNGRVVAVDLQQMAALGENVVVARGDILEPSGDVADLIDENAPYAVVLSDMAPSTSGSKASDQAKSFELFMNALGVARRVGKPGSAYVGKIFMSGDFPLAKKAVTESYETCRVLKPEGTRKNSTEIYIVGLGLRPT